MQNPSKNTVWVGYGSGMGLVWVRYGEFDAEFSKPLNINENTPIGGAGC